MDHQQAIEAANIQAGSRRRWDRLFIGTLILVIAESIALAVICG